MRPPPRTPLPIDPELPTIVRSLDDSGALVLVAPPGTGKTTRVPPALLEAFPDGEILVLEPRRLAARLTAERVAAELGEPIGGRVGYQIRFEQRQSATTRIRFVTEGILSRRLQSDGELHGVRAVVLDEFHERHWQTDLALALLERLRQSRRPDLKLVVMSATIDPRPIAQFLGGCPVIEVESRAHPIAVVYRDNPELRPIEACVEAALTELVEGEATGDVLVFLPGFAEIRRCFERCASLASRAGLERRMLHGSLPNDEQARALSISERRRVIFTTNVAETSLTIPGVKAVIDSGKARIAGHSLFSGVPRLTLARISRASADQRAGRAGRTAPGRCVRLYSDRDYAARAAAETPELQRIDLSEVILLLASINLGREDLRWFEAPDGEAWRRGEQLLVELGALTAEGTITEIGRRLSRFPLHPRLGRLVLDGQRRGVSREACRAAALLAERLPSRTPRAPGRSDVEHWSDTLSQMVDARFDPRLGSDLGLPSITARRAETAARQLERILDRRAADPRTVADPNAIDGRANAATRRAAETAKRSTDPATSEDALLLSLLTAFPDRVARRQRDGSFLLCGGIRAELSTMSEVSTAELIVAIDAEESRNTAGRRVRIQVASAIEADWLLDLFPDSLGEALQVRWNEERERVDCVETLLYRDLVIAESPWGRADSPEVTECLIRAALAKGLAAFTDEDALLQHRNRIRFASELRPDLALPPWRDETLEEALRAAASGLRSFAELRQLDLIRVLEQRIDPTLRTALERLAPTKLELKSGRRLTIRYETDRTPFVESRLQDFFGMREGPRIGDGRVALVLHLLAPNRRPVQITDDLSGFWQRHYPALRRELGRRYPKHSWPEDGANAAPPKPGKLR
ncbi:MAG: ATP-dependent helicase HrpB [Myxococcales bacterium]|nr:ATP-dependent helicase HrpB [Myxococcales bacterium]